MATCSTSSSPATNSESGYSSDGKSPSSTVDLDLFPDPILPPTIPADILKSWTENASEPNLDWMDEHYKDKSSPVEKPDTSDFLKPLDNPNSFEALMKSDVGIKFNEIFEKSAGKLSDDNRENFFEFPKEKVQEKMENVQQKTKKEKKIMNAYPVSYQTTPRRNKKQRSHVSSRSRPSTSASTSGQVPPMVPPFPFPMFPPPLPLGVPPFLAPPPPLPLGIPPFLTPPPLLPSLGLVPQFTPPPLMPPTVMQMMSNIQQHNSMQLQQFMNAQMQATNRLMGQVFQNTISHNNAQSNAQSNRKTKKQRTKKNKEIVTLDNSNNDDVLVDVEN